jgi:peptidyl-prolyl cis-trans isomerase C
MLWFPAFAGMTAFVFAASAAQAKVLDRTVMLSELERNADPILAQFKKGSPASEQTPERIADIKKRVLDQMVDDRLLVEESKKKNIRISQLEVDDGVKKVRSRFNTEEEFNKEMQKEGMGNDDFRKHIQDQLATIKLIDQEVKAKVPPPGDDEIKQLYDTLDAIIKDKPIPGSYTASELDELKALAKAVQHRFDERARARHILVRVPPNASKEEKDAAFKKIKDIQARLKKGEDFGELAKKYSDDPGSKDRGGDLGYFSRGDMVPAFDKAVFALNVGQNSDIVETDFGYHIIQLEEKKAASKMSLEDIKDDLREYLFQQRGAKRFETYVKDLRSKADIKINSLD